MMLWRFASVVLLALAPALGTRGHAQANLEDVLRTFEATVEPAQARPGQVVTLRVAVKVDEPFYTYPTSQGDPKALEQVNRFAAPKSGPLVALGQPTDPAGGKVKDDTAGTGAKELRYHPGGATFERRMIVDPDAPAGDGEVKFRFELLVCKDGICFPPERRNFALKFTVLPGGPVEVSPADRDALAAARAASAAKKSPEAKPPEAKVTPINVEAVPLQSGGLTIPRGGDFARSLETVLGQLPAPETSNAGFIAFLLAAVFWGGVTLLTPCVFPMIPITVSFFIKQGEKKQHNPLVMALVYTLTIVVVLGLASIPLLSKFQDLSVSPVTNVALGVLFVVFALSLFGMFDLRLPGFLARFTSQREGQGGYLGVVFMAFSFTIVSFTCVAPFLGGFAGLAASGNFSKFQLAMGGIAFAGTFAAPFFLLALFPALMKKLPRSGDWMNTVKVVMGFLEVAAALKFFRTAEIRWATPPQLFTYDFVLSMWIVLLVFCALYLLGLYRLPHDYPQEHIGVSRMLVGVLAATVAVYLLPALFARGSDGSKQRPAGFVYAWVDAFLLPEPSAAEIFGKGELAWSGDLLRAAEDARAKGGYLFIDFTGVTCSNCKLNEKNVFVKDNVKDLLRRYHLVQLYTDTVPEHLYESPAPDLATREDHATAVKKFQQRAFGSSQLPLYVILRPRPDGQIERVGVYSEGKINDEAAFVRFLQAPFERQ